MQDEPRIDALYAQLAVPRPRSLAWAWALVVLVVGLGVSLWLANHVLARGHESVARETREETARAAASVLAQLRDCESLERAFQSIFFASNEVTPEEFRRAFHNLQSDGATCGSVVALRYLERAVGQGGDAYATVMLEPESARTLRSVVNEARLPEDAKALRRARDVGALAMSPAFALPDGRKVVALHLPVYQGGSVPATTAERRRLHAGSISLLVQVDALLATAAAGTQKTLASLALLDRAAPGAGALAMQQFGAHTGTAQARVRIAFGGQDWELATHSRVLDLATTNAVQTLAVGAIISLLLAALCWSLVGARARAIALGTAMSLRFQASEERFRRLTELLPSLLLLVRAEDGAIVYRNATARAKLGSDGGVADVRAILTTAAQADVGIDPGPDGRPLEAALHDADGAMFWANVFLTRITVDSVPMWLLVANDTSEQRLLTERLGYQASHDSLTGLFNRRAFEGRASALLAHAATDPTALLFIDLDQFKLINDTAGHPAGDALLIQIAAVMQEVLRPGDTLARLGGDEFGLLLPGLRQESEAIAVAERIRRGVEGVLFRWNGRDYSSSTSIGVVMLEAGSTLRDVFAHADAACYLAKEAGRNRIHLYARNDAAIQLRLGEMEWVPKIQAALREGRLLLDFQELHPLQPERTGEGPGVELLLRLRDAHGNEVLPAEFLPAAERYDLMPAIDRWVVETALGNLDRIHLLGSALSNCAINLSGASIEDDGLVRRIAELIDRHRIDPGRLVFELTETVAVRDFAKSSRLISGLRALGCRVALDDFGAGMSSFAYLKDLELDLIKIDGSFIQGLANDTMSQSIVRAVTEIGHQRGAAVVAEWVSTAALLDMLRTMGVDFAQGFHLHRPERVLFQRTQHDG